MLPHAVFQIIVQYVGLERSIKKQTQIYMYHAGVFEVDSKFNVYTQPFKKFLLELDLVCTAMHESDRFPGYTGYRGRPLRVNG